MAKRFGFSAAAASLTYIRDNVDVGWVMGSGGATYQDCTASYIVSSNVSSADLTIACAAQGPVLTVGAKNNQLIEGSGTATHFYLVNSSAERILFITEITSQVLSSGNTVNLGTWTVTANQTANNSS